MLVKLLQWNILYKENIDNVINSSDKGYKEIKYQLSYPLKERILSNIKKRIPPFLILYDILTEEKGQIKTLSLKEEAFRERKQSSQE